MRHRRSPDGEPSRPRPAHASTTTGTQAPGTPRHQPVPRLVPHAVPDVVLRAGLWGFLRRRPLLARLIAITVAMFALITTAALTDQDPSPVAPAGLPTAGAAAAQPLPARPPMPAATTPAPSPAPPPGVPPGPVPSPTQGPSPGVSPTPSGPASPAPAPEPSRNNGPPLVPCNLPVASQLCEAYGGTREALSFASDPLGYLADKVKDCVAMVLRWFAGVVNDTSSPNWTDPGFLRTYTMMFGLATFVTAMLWLIAVGKRVVAGVGPGEAIGESIGYLILAVMVTAFAPAAVALLTTLVDQMATAMFRPVLGDITALEGTIVKVFALFSTLAGGQLFITIFGLFLLFAIVSVWVELVLRSAMIYLALVFGPLSFAGLVDRALWDSSKTWVGVMAAIIFSKPITLTVLALTLGLMRRFEVGMTITDPTEAAQILFMVTALFFIAFMLPMLIGKFVPVFGDQLATIAAARRDATQQLRDSAPAAKSAADEMRSGTAGRLDKAGDAVDKATGKVEDWDRGNAKKSAGSQDAQPDTGTDQDTTGPDDAAATDTGTDAAGDKQSTNAQGQPFGPDLDGGGPGAGADTAQAGQDAAGTAGTAGDFAGAASFEGAEAAGAGAGGAEAAAAGAGPVGAGAFAAKEAADQVMDTAQQAVDSGAARATGAAPSGSGGDSGGGPAGGGGGAGGEGPQMDVVRPQVEVQGGESHEPQPESRPEPEAPPAPSQPPRPPVS